MKTFTAIVERDPDTKFYVGYVPGFPGAHSQGETLDELQENLREVIEMLLEMPEIKLYIKWQRSVEVIWHYKTPFILP
ncbi:MAG: type II toxin-antitoxin system HicB family antitoxin [Nostoc sp.]|uniref:type II toxin-antitoxin system HicB family antitoxin n=1 Tax=Nostoc sp. TaxID=1180 RepID=UPI002FFCF21C